MNEIQRPNYFTSQFLVAEDFTEEQAYHREMRWLHNRSLHTPGIVQGLTVTATGAKEITVSPGMAIDSKGREIVISPEVQSPLSQPISLERVGTGRTIVLTIRYRQVQDRPTQIENQDQFTRTIERPKFIIYGGSTAEDPENGNVEIKTENEPDNDSNDIPLCNITLDNSGNISNSDIDNSIRTSAGSKLITPRQFVKGIINTQNNNNPIIPLPSGTTIDDWEVFVSVRELSVSTSNPFIREFGITVTASAEATGWRVICQAKVGDGSIIEGSANYLLLRK
ncbi:MAG: hypothetical protein AB4057_05850 [Crocosphaera sp.]